MDDAVIGTHPQLTGRDRERIGATGRLPESLDEPAEIQRHHAKEPHASAGQHPLPAAIERDGRRSGRQIWQLYQLFSGIRRPQSHPILAGAGHDVATVRRDGDCTHGLVMAQDMNRRTGVGSPNSSRRIVRCGDEESAVRRDGAVVHCTVVTFELLYQSECAHIPNAYPRALARCSYQPISQESHLAGPLCLPIVSEWTCRPPPDVVEPYAIGPRRGKEILS